MSKSLLLISRQSPWSGPGAREALDIALAGGAYDLPISVLYLDDGVFQLVDQNAARLQQKDLTANLKALPLFGVEALYACATSLAERGLTDARLGVEPLRIIDDTEITALIDHHDHVITL